MQQLFHFSNRIHLMNLEIHCWSNTALQESVNVIVMFLLKVMFE